MSVKSAATSESDNMFTYSELHLSIITLTCVCACSMHSFTLSSSLSRPYNLLSIKPALMWSHTAVISKSLEMKEVTTSTN